MCLNDCRDCGTTESRTAESPGVQLQLSHGSLNFTALSRKYFRFTSLTRSRIISWGSELAYRKHENGFTSALKSNAVRCCPLVAEVDILHF